MHVPRRSALAVAVLVAAALVAGAVPASAGEATHRASAFAKAGTTTYVGSVKGAGSLAVVVDEDGAFAYLCDSADVSAWFRGTNNDGALDLRAPSGATIAAGVKGKLLDGVLVTPDGTATSFKLKAAKGDAGLYRAEQAIDGTGYAAGWVVLPDGTVDGRVTAANLPGTAVLPTPVVATQIAANTGTAVPPAAILGAVASAAVAAAFPADPPPADQVTVVPFNSSQNTAENPGGGSNQDSGPSGGPTTTTPVAQCKSVDQLNSEIAALQKALDDAGLLKRRAIKQQIGSLQAELHDAERGLNCTLPLK